MNSAEDWVRCPGRNRKIVTTLGMTLSVLGCFALLPVARAVFPPPDGGYPNGNTAEGQAALLNLTTGAFNTGVGIFAVRSATAASFNTDLGAGALPV
jgi:hypothetical protein